MVMDGQVYAVLVAQLVDLIKSIKIRFADQRLDAHVFGELKCFVVVRSDAHVHQLYALVGQVALDVLAVCGGHLGTKDGAVVLAELLPMRVRLDDLQAQFGSLIDGFEKREGTKRIGLASEPLAELLSVRRAVGFFFGQGAGVRCAC